MSYLPWIAGGAVAGYAARRGRRTEQPYRFSGLICPLATSDLVDWSRNSWWYPTTIEEIEWEDFKKGAHPTPQDVTASGYLGWTSDWMSFDQFLERPAEDEWSFYRGSLPSGLPVYVWVGSGIEHWWTLGGAEIDVYYEQELLEKLQDRLEGSDNVPLDQVTRILRELRD